MKLKAEFFEPDHQARNASSSDDESEIEPLSFKSKKSIFFAEIGSSGAPKRPEEKFVLLHTIHYGYFRLVLLSKIRQALIPFLVI